VGLNEKGASERAFGDGFVSLGYLSERCRMPKLAPSSGLKGTEWSIVRALGGELGDDDVSGVNVPRAS
jgi:hypothetical protein